MTAPLTPPLTDEQFDSYAEIVQANTWKESKARIVIADARWHRAELAKAKAGSEQLLKALIATTHWIERDCQPGATYAGQGHNWNMSAEDRQRGQDILTQAHTAIAPEGKDAP